MPTPETTAENPLVRRLIDRHDGSRQKTADAIGVSRETIRLWLRDGFPLERALDIEEKSGGLVTAGEILQDARRANGGAEKVRASA